MDISYLGHSSFRIKTKTGAVVTDPFSKSSGLTPPSVNADIVTVSHQHDDHNSLKGVSGTTRRPQPFVISEPGEYEVEGISIFGYPTFHDETKGEERGENVIYLIQAEGLRLLHLGDLGHPLSASLIEELGSIDILMVPVGGVYTIGVKEALEVIDSISPSMVIPMHYRTEKHSAQFDNLATLKDFKDAAELEARLVEDNKLKVDKLSLTETDMEIVVFE